MLPREASRPWWSWPRWGVGFATPLLLYALWVTFIVVYAHRLAAEQAADPDPAPDSAAGYFFLFMVVLSVVLVVVFVVAAAVLCIFRRLRAFGVGALVGILLPVLVLGGYLLFTWYLLAGAVDG